MKYKKDDLLTVLDILKPNVMKDDSLVILKNLYFNKETIQATNLSSGCIVEFETDLNCLIPFDKLYIFVKGSGSEIEIIHQDDNITLKSGRSKSTISVESVNDYPELDNVMQYIDESVDLTDNNIIDIFKIMKLFVAKRSARFELTGICIDENQISATDSVRIASYQYHTDLGSGIIPIDFVNAISIMKEINSFYMDDKIVVAYNNNTTVFANLIDGEYPDISKYLTVPEKLIELPTEELKKGLIKVGDFSGEVQETASCNVSISSNEISVKFESSVAKINEFFDFGKKLEDIEFSINPYYLSAILDKCNRFAISDNILYGESDDKNLKCIIALLNK